MKRKTVTLIHEQLQGRHRIVSISSDGTNEAGLWAHDTELAQYKGLRASTGFIEGLPIGIFTTSSKTQQVLA